MSGPELCFVSPVGGSIFMDELFAVVADAVRAIGGKARSVAGNFPEADADTVYVIVPHEFFYTADPESWPSEDQRSRCVAFCVEHPGTLTFERSAALIGCLGGAVDINHESIAELRRRGLAAEHFQLGYSELMDKWGGDLDSPRNLDVTYLGTAERRRSKLLSSFGMDLSSLRVRLLTPPHEPMRLARPDFLPGDLKLRHLADTRLLLNLHRSSSTALEWFRVVEAICNGCVVITERSTDFAPLVPNSHFLMCGSSNLGAIAAAVARTPEFERELRASAYEFARARLDTKNSARVLLEVASGVLASGRKPLPLPKIPPPGDISKESPLAVDTPPWRAGGVALCEPESLGSGRVGPGYGSSAATFAAPSIGQRQRAGGAEAEIQADIDVLIVHRAPQVSPRDLILDLLSGSLAPRRILVCWDGTSPDTAVLADHQVVNSAARGIATSLNALLGFASADFLFVLDADMRVESRCLELLSAPKASVAHCPVVDTAAGLVGALPSEERRLVREDYLGNGYLVDRSLVDKLGGWPAGHGECSAERQFWLSVVAQDLDVMMVQRPLISRS